ncbi:hypothetical protein V6Z12_D10G181400 [Gossypium hirsutum]
MNRWCQMSVVMACGSSGEREEVGVHGRSGS